MSRLLRRLWAACLFLSLAGVAQAAALTVLVDTSTQMPVADIRNGQLLGGLHLDLGQALAAQLGRTARFKVLPRKRIPLDLESGAADIICTYLPAWLPGPFDWSEPFIPSAELLVSLRKQPRPANLAAVAGQPVATVLGFVYPEMEQALGPQFVRDDAPNMESSWRKLAAGRIPYGLFPRLFVDYKLRQGELAADPYNYLVVQSSPTRCAVSRRGQVTLAEVNKAIAGLLARHELERMLARYRPQAPAQR